MSLRITRIDYGDVTVLELDGRINLGSGAVVFRKTVRDLLKEGRLKLVVVQEGVSFVDSAGNGELVTAYTTARNVGGDLVFAGREGAITNVFQITKLFTVFQIFDTVRDALSYFAKGKTRGKPPA
jgi:anti-sigma B factor antagonist